jgi:hypothetical protein
MDIFVKIDEWHSILDSKTNLVERLKSEKRSAEKAADQQNKIVKFSFI